MSSNNNNNNYDDGGVDLLDLLIILAAQKKFIIKTVLLFVLFGVSYALLATPIYKSELKFTPPFSQPSSGGMSTALAALGGAADFAISALGIKAPGDLVIGIGKSSPVLDAAIDRLGLMNVSADVGFISQIIASVKDTFNRVFFGADDSTEKGVSRISVREEFLAKIDFVTDLKSGIITLSVKDTSPDVTAETTTVVFEELQNYLQNQALSQAAQQRVFLEKQLQSVIPALAEAELKLTAYQVRTGIINVGEQGSALMERLAQLRAAAATKEVELSSAQQFATGRNPQVRRIQAELDELRSQLRKLEAASGGSVPSELGLQDLPDAGLEYMRLMRDFKFQEAIYAMLLKQYESARISEAQEPIVVQLLSPAEVPERRESPRRTLIVTLAGFLGVAFAFMGAFVRHFWSNVAESPAMAEKKQVFKKLWRGK